MKPPAVIMLTPSGRFKPNRRICLSMSDFHPESWNPMWSVSTILTGLLSFMLDFIPTSGSMESSIGTKRLLAGESMDYNLRDRVFVDNFKEIVDAYQIEKKRLGEVKLLAIAASESSSGSSSGADTARLGLFNRNAIPTGDQPALLGGTINNQLNINNGGGVVNDILLRDNNNNNNNNNNGVGNKNLGNGGVAGNNLKNNRNRKVGNKQSKVNELLIMVFAVLVIGFLGFEMMV